MKADRSIVVSIDDIEGYQLGDRKTGTFRIIKDVLQSRNLRVHLGTFPVGQASSRHVHPYSEEICYIIRGQGKVTIGREIKQYCSNALIFIPPGVHHQYSNIGKDELVLIAVYSPPTEMPKE